MPQNKKQGVPESVMDQCQRIAREGNDKYLKESDARLQYGAFLFAVYRLTDLHIRRAIEKDAKRITQEAEKRSKSKK